VLQIDSKEAEIIIKEKKEKKGKKVRNYIEKQTQGND